MSEKQRLKFTILGCGSSPGVPRIHGDWGNCDPTNPKNRRRRASMLVQRIGLEGTTSIVIDTGPDFREQMLDVCVEHIDGVLYTHPHADHTHGIDDLRGYVLVQKHRVRTFSDQATFEKLKASFGYCFNTPEHSNYPPILKHTIIKPYEKLSIDGAGGAIDILPIRQEHGTIHSLGFRFGNFDGDTPLAGGLCYSSDVSALEDETTARLKELDVWIVDALMYRPHASHFSLSQALEWIEKLRPRKAILTHMHTPLDYKAVMDETPNHVEPAFDGMEIELEI